MGSSSRRSPRRSSAASLMPHNPFTRDPELGPNGKDVLAALALFFYLGALVVAVLTVVLALRVDR